MRNVRSGSTKRLTAGLVAVAMSASVLAGCGVPANSDSTDAVGTDVAGSVEDDGATDEKKGGKGASVTNLTGGESVNGKSEDDEGTSEELPTQELISDISEISAYAVEEGYLGAQPSSDPDFTKVIDNANDWNKIAYEYGDYAEDSAGTVTPFHPGKVRKGFKAYDQSFFDKGHRILVAYRIYLSPVTSPSVSSWDVSQDSKLVVNYDPGISEESGLAGVRVIAEIPAGTNISQIHLEDGQQ